MEESIARINGANIVTVEQDGETFVPVKPICDAIGIDFKVQHRKIESESILSSTMVIMTTVGADGKNREMVCLPLKYIYGWLFTINPGKVAPEAREAVERYRRECYEVLYDHFAERRAASRSRTPPRRISSTVRSPLWSQSADTRRQYPMKTPC